MCARVRACTRWQQWRSDTTLAHHLCVCEGLPGDACVYLLIWPAVTLMGFGCKHLISFKIWTFIVDITHRSCMQNMSNSWTDYLILHNISKVAPSPDLASLQRGHCVASVLVPITSTTQMGFNTRNCSRNCSRSLLKKSNAGSRTTSTYWMLT